MNVRVCKNVGVAGTTECFIKEHEDGSFEARIGIALMGTTNMKQEHFEACNYNPFHKKFFDNYACGKGNSPEQALENMRKDMRQTSETLFA